ncbi:MAG: hypothetical protein WD492_08765 [Alkalispirochaeta sp.]
MSSFSASPRAEEIIAELYGSVARIRETGKSVTAIVLPMSLYRTIQEYRATLGETRQGLPDYLGKYDLFGIPIYTDGGDDVIIKTGTTVLPGG